jgi:putative lipoprotein
VIGVPVTALFDEDGTISGQGGCNSYTGSWETDENSIEIGPLASTAMACAEAEVTDQETRYLAVLQDAASYRVDATTLEMFDAEATRLVQYLRAATP